MVLVTGSAGYLGEALMRGLSRRGLDVAGLDLVDGEFVDFHGSVTNRALVQKAVADAEYVIHTAALHKPQLDVRAKQDFVETNITGTLCLLEAAANAGIRSFVFTGTTSSFGYALTADTEAANWIDETTVARPKNMYGVTKAAAEDVCEVVHRETGLPVIVLRTSRFFPEGDDDPDRAEHYEDQNLKVLELLNRRCDVQDLVDLHGLAIGAAGRLGFAKFIGSATSPFVPEDVRDLRVSPEDVILRRSPDSTAVVFEKLRWSFPDEIRRVYDNSKARRELGWNPQYDFARAIGSLAAGQSPWSPLTTELNQAPT